MQSRKMFSKNNSKLNIILKIDIQFSRNKIIYNLDKIKTKKYFNLKNSIKERKLGFICTVLTNFKL